MTTESRLIEERIQELVWQLEDLRDERKIKHADLLMTRRAIHRLCQRIAEAKKMLEETRC